MNRSSRLLTKIILIILIIVVVSCAPENDSPPDESENFVDISLLVNKNDDFRKNVYHAVAEVTAPDIDTLRYHYFTSQDTSAWILKKIPKGKIRKISIVGYDEKRQLVINGNIQNFFLDGDTLFNIDLRNKDDGTLKLPISVSSFSLEKSTIVFEADYNGSLDIYSMQPDGTGLKQLTHSEYDDYHPRLSPDKSKISFSRKINGAHRPYIMNVDGTNLESLNILEGQSIPSLDWSPDGTKLVFRAGETPGYYVFELYTYDLENGNLKQILKNGTANWLPRWSPDGEKIIFYSDITGISRIYTIHPDGNEMKMLTNTEGFEEKVPAFSPDGSLIVFAGRYYGDWNIYIMNSNGIYIKIVAEQTLDEHFPTFSPNGSRIIFQRKTDEKGNGIYTMDKSGENLQMILDTNFNEQRAHWR